MSDGIARCDLCGGDSFDVISRFDRNSRPLDTGLCRGCGMVRHLRLPSEQSLSEYYSGHYRHDYHGDHLPSDRRIMRAWNNAGRIYRQLEPKLGDVKSMFEVGTGIGCTVKFFETRGTSASGIEPSREFYDFSRNQLYASVENASLYELNPEPCADMVLLVHVIEHFMSPKRALNHVRSMLHENGMLYIECPNVAAPFAPFHRMFHYAHIYNFTPKTLQALVELCGFELVEKYTGNKHADIRMLFRKVDKKPEPQTLTGHADWVLSRMNRFNLVSYHLRPSYLIRRSRKLFSYLMEHIQAREFVSSLLSRLEKEAG